MAENFAVDNNFVSKNKTITKITVDGKEYVIKITKKTRLTELKNKLKLMKGKVKGFQIKDMLALLAVVSVLSAGAWAINGEHQLQEHDKMEKAIESFEDSKQPLMDVLSKLDLKVQRLFLEEAVNDIAKDEHYPNVAENLNQRMDMLDKLQQDYEAELALGDFARAFKIYDSIKMETQMAISVCADSKRDIRDPQYKKYMGAVVQDGKVYYNVDDLENGKDFINVIAFPDDVNHYVPADYTEKDLRQKK